MGPDNYSQHGNMTAEDSSATSSSLASAGSGGQEPSSRPSEAWLLRRNSHGSSGGRPGSDYGGAAGADEVSPGSNVRSSNQQPSSTSPLFVNNSFGGPQQHYSAAASGLAVGAAAGYGYESTTNSYGQPYHAHAAQQFSAGNVYSGTGGVVQEGVGGRNTQPPHELSTALSAGSSALSSHSFNSQVAAQAAGVAGGNVSGRHPAAGNFSTNGVNTAKDLYPDAPLNGKERKDSAGPVADEHGTESLSHVVVKYDENGGGIQLAVKSLSGVAHRVPPVESQGVWQDVKEAVAPYKALILPEKDPFRPYRGRSTLDSIKLAIYSCFPILDWLPKYKKSYLFGDIVGGLTVASICIPQDLAYARLAHLPSIYGLYTSFPPPLVYAGLGTSRQIVIAPVAVVSLVVGQLLIKQCDPEEDFDRYLRLAITTTFFAGIFTLSMGVMRLGFIVDYFSHAAVVGFMAGAAITVLLSQLKGLLGYTKYTNNTDIVSVGSAIVDGAYQFNWTTFVIGMSFLLYLIALKVLLTYSRGGKIGWLAKPLFYINALGPLTCVIVGTLAVGLSGVYKDGVKVVGNIPKGVNPTSFNLLILSGADLGHAITSGIIVSVIGLTEVVALGRTFAFLKGYKINGSQEMVAVGTMNIVGSFTSCYAASGSFSRSAVNYATGAETMISNVVMSIVVLLTLLFITPLFKYLPIAVLSAIIINALLSLIDIHGAYRILKTDKIDALAMLGAFLGVLFISIEFGILIALAISIVKLLVQVTRPQISLLGLVRGTQEYCDLDQYADLERPQGVLVFRIGSALYFPNANFIQSRILEELEVQNEEKHSHTTHIILDFSSVPDIDTTGINMIVELHGELLKKDVQLVITNPTRTVLNKLSVDGFLQRLGDEWLFLTLHEAVKVVGLIRAGMGLNGHDSA